MSKGDGGKIPNWKKTGQQEWTYQGNTDAKMEIGNKTNRGYPIILKGKNVRNSPNTLEYQPTKKKAFKKAADIRRKIS